MRIKPKAQHSIFERPTREAKNPNAKWRGGHKYNAESKHIYFSFISIQYKLNLPRASDAKPQFASWYEEIVLAPRVPSYGVVPGGKNFSWDHFLKELRNQAQLSSQAYWICAQAFACLRDLFNSWIARMRKSEL